MSNELDFACLTLLKGPYVVCCDPSMNAIIFDSMFSFLAKPKTTSFESSAPEISIASCKKRACLPQYFSKKALGDICLSKLIEIFLVI